MCARYESDVMHAIVFYFDWKFVRKGTFDNEPTLVNVMVMELIQGRIFENKH